MCCLHCMVCCHSTSVELAILSLSFGNLYLDTLVILLSQRLALDSKRSFTFSPNLSDHSRTLLSILRDTMSLAMCNSVSDSRLSDRKGSLACERRGPSMYTVIHRSIYARILGSIKPWYAYYAVSSRSPGAESMPIHSLTEDSRSGPK